MLSEGFGILLKPKRRRNVWEQVENVIISNNAFSSQFPLKALGYTLY